MALKNNEQAIINLVINGQAANASLRELSGTYNALYAAVSKLKKADDPALYDEKIKLLGQVKAARDAERDSIIGGAAASKQFNQEFTAGMAEMQNATSSFREGLNTIKEGFESLGIGLGIAELISYGKELLNLAVKASGVQQAFSKIGNTEGMIEKLREASRGLISDLDLEKIAVKANNANIPLENMGIFLKFAQQRAQETGESVTDLTEKLIEGLGKGTPKALAGLGVNVAEVKREFKETGDMVQAVTNIINKEMNQAGDDVETFGERVEKTKTAWENIKEKAAGIFKKIFSPDLADADNIEKLTNKEMKQFEDYEKLKDDQLNVAIQKQAARDQKFKAAYLKAQQELQTAQEEANKKGGDVYTDVSGQEAKVKSLAEQYQAVSNALSALNKEREKRGAKASDGSVESIDQEITRLRSLQSQLSSTSAEYKKYEDLIKIQEDKKADITGIHPGDAAAKKKLDEYLKQLQSVREQTDQLAEAARKGTVDDLEAQLKVIQDKYQKVIAEINKLLKDPHTTAAIRKELSGRINTLTGDEKLDEANTTAAFKRAQDEKAKKENEDRLKAGSGQVNNVYDQARSDLDTSENSDLNNVKASDPRIAEELRLNIQDVYAKKRYELEQQNLQDLKTLRQAYGKDTSDLDKKMADNTIKENQRAAKKKEEDDKKYLEAKKQIENMEMDNLQAGATLLESVLDKKSALYKAALIVDKAVAVARVIVNTNQAIAAFAAANAGIPIVGEALIAEYTAQAYVQEAIEIASIVAATAQGLSGGAKAAKGGIFDGPSHDAGGLNVVNPKTGETVANVEGNEPWMVLSKETRKNNGALINQLLYNSMYRNGATVDSGAVNRGVQHAKNGGIFNQQSSTGFQTFAGQSQTAPYQSGRMDRIEQSLHGLIQVVQSEAEKPVVWSNRAAETEQKKIVQIRTNAKG